MAELVIKQKGGKPITVRYSGGPGGYECHYKGQTFWSMTKGGLEAKVKKAGDGFKSNRSWWM